MIIPLRH